VENPFNAKGKNHEHQPATISLSQEFGVTRLWRLTRESSLRPKPPVTGLRFASSEARPISCSEFGTTPTFDANSSFMESSTQTKKDLKIKRNIEKN
jgi:hypothetical protein